MSDLKISEERYLELIDREKRLNRLLDKANAIILELAIVRAKSQDGEILKAEVAKIIKDYGLDRE